MQLLTRTWLFLLVTALPFLLGVNLEFAENTENLKTKMSELRLYCDLLVQQVDKTKEVATSGVADSEVKYCFHDITEMIQKSSARPPAGICSLTILACLGIDWSLGDSSGILHRNACIALLGRTHFPTLEGIYDESIKIP